MTKRVSNLVTGNIAMVADKLVGFQVVNLAGIEVVLRIQASEYTRLALRGVLRTVASHSPVGIIGITEGGGGVSGKARCERVRDSHRFVSLRMGDEHGPRDAAVAEYCPKSPVMLFVVEVFGEAVVGES